jgi:hypothetical protein
VLETVLQISLDCIGIPTEPEGNIFVGYARIVQRYAGCNPNGMGLEQVEVLKKIDIQVGLCANTCFLEEFLDINP